MKLSPCIGMVLAATVAITPVARASDISFTQLCGGSNFLTCASVTVSTSESGGITTVTMTVTNDAGFNGTFSGTTFNQIALWGLPQVACGNKMCDVADYVDNSLTVTDITGGGSVDQSGNWQLGDNGIGGGFVSQDIKGVDGNTGNDAVPGGSTFVFTFQLTGLASNFDVSTAGVVIHGQRGPNSCSTKFVYFPDGSTNQGPFDENCAETPPCTDGSCTTVPEPVSMTLVATGLAGMGVIGRRRRKQNVA